MLAAVCDTGLGKQVVECLFFRFYLVQKTFSSLLLD